MIESGGEAIRGAQVRGVLRALIHKEVRELVRDGRFWIVAGALASLLMVALAFGLRQSAAVGAERLAAQATADEHFRAQDNKNPHVAAHYGSYVFKPAGALSFIDPGIEPYVGVSVKLQAHARSSPEGASATDPSSLARVGRMSVAAILQLLIPLLIVGLGFSAWTSERERGTLRLIAMSGVRRSLLFAGKILGLGVGLGALLLPTFAIGGAIIALLGHDHAQLGRLITLLGSYLVYFGVFLALTLAVSALADSSRSSLVLLIGAWVMSTLVFPRVATDLSALVAPTPPPAELAVAIKKSMIEGRPGGPQREERVDALTDVLLEKQGFKDAETLMDAAALASTELQAEAQFENEVIDFHYEQLADSIERQEVVLNWMAVVSPPLAMQALSSALAGTDYAHHRNFSDAAERHRRTFIEMLNREVGAKGGADAWNYQAGRDTWARAPRFEYEHPSLAWVLSRQRISLAILLSWFVGSLLLARRTSLTMGVV
jgi:ABC-2 type transport system permease protein